jgi:hypothetical protein
LGGNDQVCEGLIRVVLFGEKTSKLWFNWTSENLQSFEKFYALVWNGFGVRAWSLLSCFWEVSNGLSILTILGF